MEGDNIIVSAEIDTDYKKWVMINDSRRKTYKLSEDRLNNQNYMQPYRTIKIYMKVEPFLG